MTARRRTPSARRGPLDRRVIAEAALALIDAEGLDALSMRKLGAALGVEAMALYHHFTSKGDLIDGVLELLLEEAEPPPGEPAEPLVRIRRHAENMRGVAIAHPQAFMAVGTRRFRTRPALEFYERLLQTFRDAGFDASQSARWFRVMAAFVNGAGLAEVGFRSKHPDAMPVILENFSDPVHFPRVTEAVPHLRAAKLGAIFEFGLDLIFGAMAREAAGARPRKKGGASQRMRGGS